MSITNITKRVANFYDDKGEWIAKKAFSKTANTINFAGGTFNVLHDKASYTLVKRWYWNVYNYHYNINNPDAFKFGKVAESIISPEVYYVHLNTNMLKKLNDLNKKKFQLDIKIILLLIGAAILGYFLLTGHKIA